jgi:hypothetical protein
MESPIITVVYSHGRHGSPWYGFKIEALRPIALKMGINILSIKYPEDISVDAMEAKLLSLVSDDVSVPGDLIFLSSSRGAYISTRISAKVNDLFRTEAQRMDDDKKLPKRNLLGQFLIAPAFYIKPDYYPDQNPKPVSNEIFETVIVHGFDDTVIACDNSVRFSKQEKAQLHLVEGGHRLNSQRDLLCKLFEVFLAGQIGKSNLLFESWKKANPQEFSSDDDSAPNRKK